MSYLECVVRFGIIIVTHNYDALPSTPSLLTDFTTGNFTIPGTPPDSPWALVPGSSAGTDLTVAAVATDTTLTVTTTSGMTIGDKVGVELDTGDWFWARIANLIGNDVVFDDGLPSGAAIGNRVAVVGQLDTTIDFALEENFKLIKANSLLARTSELQTNFIVHEDKEFQLTNDVLGDSSSFFASAKEPTKFTLETADGLGYMFTDYEDLNTLIDLLAEAHSTIISDQASLIDDIVNAANSQVAMDAIVDSRTPPTPTGSGTYKPFLQIPVVRTSTATENVDKDDDYIRIDATAATRVLTLPDATTVPIGKDFRFKLVAKGIGFYGEITPFSGDSIDGLTNTRRLVTVGDVFTLRKVSDTAWDIIQNDRIAHASMYMSGIEFTQSSIGTTAVTVTTWTGNGSDSEGVVKSDQTNNKFVIEHVEDTVNGDNYRIIADISYDYPIANVLELSVFVGGVVTNILSISQGLGTSNDQLNITLTGDFNIISAGDVEIKARSISGTNTAKWWTGNVYIEKI